MRKPMAKLEEDQAPPTGHEKAWAVVRVILGQAQMMGAIASFCLLVQTGVNALSLGAVVVTGLLTTTSMLLFGSRHRQDQ
jgi:hypothetical protein